MRRLIRWLLAAAFFGGGCAYEGTIVRKDFRPLPFSNSLGMDAIYHFELRGSDGMVHSQLVNAAAFANYEVGDYFSARRPLPLTGRDPFLPDFQASRAGPLENYGTRYPMVPPLQPVPPTLPSPRGQLQHGFQQLLQNSGHSVTGGEHFAVTKLTSAQTSRPIR